MSEQASRDHRQPAVPYSAVELDESADSIEDVQLDSGLIPWSHGAHGDPWNHVEALMALSARGHFAAAERGYEWLLANQRLDGPWHAYYESSGEIEESRLDTNVSAYVAAGVWQHFATTRDRGFLETMWPVIDRVISWVVGYQRKGGGFTWAVEPDGSLGRFALVTASSSICVSLDAAVRAARELGHERPSWTVAAARCRIALATLRAEFAAKDEFAMDWYYPILGGAFEESEALHRIEAGWSTWVVDGGGVRCRSDGEWLTTAETAECAIACLLIGERDRARALLEWSRRQLRPGGTFATGLVGLDGVEFPAGERTTYSTAAVILANELFAGTTSVRSLFALANRYDTPVVTSGVAGP